MLRSSSLGIVAAIFVTSWAAAHPRPPVIRERDVLAHGLRHLAFLMNREPEGELARALNPAGRMMLSRLKPTVAGQLSVPERQQEKDRK